MRKNEPVCGPDFVSEAEIFLKLRTAGRSAEVIGREYGVSGSYVRHSIRLSKLPGNIRAALAKGEITRTHALAWLELKDPSLMASEFEKVKSSGDHLSKKDIKRKVLNYQVMNSNLALEEDRLRQVLGTSVEMTGDRESGKITIKYKSRMVFDRIMSLMEGSRNDSPKQLSEVFGRDFTI